MIPDRGLPPLTLPPGRCLTDIWPDLRSPARRRWLAVVAREAREVSMATRAATAPARPWDAAGAVQVADQEREAGRRRLAELQQAVDGGAGRPHGPRFITRRREAHHGDDLHPV